jgi:hypothetical protein
MSIERLATEDDIDLLSEIAKLPEALRRALAIAMRGPLKIASYARSERLAGYLIACVLG